MILRHEPDVSQADWLLRTEADEWTLVTQGPPGFEAYATVWFDDGESERYRTDEQIMAIVVGQAAQHTRTPDDVFFGLWDGWGELTDAGRVYTTVRGNWLRDLWFRPTPPRVGAAFDESVLAGEKVGPLFDREYLLFRGPAADVGRWGARPYAPELERTLPPASIAWPADRAWFIASDVDPSWLCVGGSHRLIDALLAHPDLDAEPAIHGEIPVLQLEER